MHCSSTEQKMMCANTVAIKKGDFEISTVVSENRTHTTPTPRARKEGKRVGQAHTHKNLSDWWAHQATAPSLSARKLVVAITRSHHNERQPAGLPRVLVGES
jgi:hypothetical protein